MLVIIFHAEHVEAVKALVMPEYTIGRTDSYHIEKRAGSGNAERPYVVVRGSEDVSRHARAEIAQHRLAMLLLKEVGVLKGRESW